jgi:DNA-binding Lrp family transcriptional regulator
MTGNGKPKLSVFKGREAKLNRAVLLVLAQESPLSIRQVYKRVRACKGFRHTRYRVVNRRMKSLENEGYIEHVATEKRPQGFVARICQPTTKAYVALALEAVNFNALIGSTKEDKLTALLATILDIAMDS